MWRTPSPVRWSMSASFLIVNHGVPEEAIRRIFAEAERFHAQPEAAKHAVLMNEHNNGYMAMARYNVRTSRVSEDVALPDMNEAFFIKRERGPDDPLAGRRFAGPNRWPEGLPGYRRHCSTIARRWTAWRWAFSAGALPLARPSGGLVLAALHPQPVHIPTLALPAGGARARPLRHRPAYGHQFPDLPRAVRCAGSTNRREGGGWEDVPFVKNSYVVNTGDMLHRWTNGRYKSTPHRALPPVGRHRYAIPYFFGPNLDAEIRCLPTCTDPDNPPRWPRRL